MKILIEGTREELIQVIPELENNRFLSMYNKSPDGKSVITLYTTNSPEARTNTIILQLPPLECCYDSIVFKGSTAEVVHTESGEVHNGQCIFGIKE